MLGGSEGCYEEEHIDIKEEIIDFGNIVEESVETKPETSNTNSDPLYRN